MGKAFTFRAQPALDLRRREHDAKRRALAAAEFALAAERRRFDQACDSLCAAREQLERQMLAPHASASLGWHRAWIHRLERSRSALASAVAEKEAHAAAAMAVCAAARQRLESLERLKEKALRAWEDAERAREQRELDAAATMRYQSAIRESAVRSTP
jgi:flagellar export protein FliJ